jgi:cell fate (sporulation/competence/biofilm development) regulator YlbF (YheA/YmcA/DUF963 family)
VVQSGGGVVQSGVEDQKEEVVAEAQEVAGTFPANEIISEYIHHKNSLN